MRPEHYSGRCSFPGEPAETLTLDLNAGKTAPLAFAFPDAKAAQACKLRLERQVDAGNGRRLGHRRHQEVTISSEHRFWRVQRVRGTAPMNEPNRDGDAARFMTTQWTHVLAARGQSAAARESLQALCERYYAPVAAFVRRYTQDDQQAQDWTHSFFAKLLEGHSLNTVLPSKGKFRSYLLGAVKHFLADERTRQQADKRGGSTRIFLSMLPTTSQLR